ncbi:hypothetical protein JW859_10280 [bacterium]|nr:hypothetical protein [bacterium]
MLFDPSDTREYLTPWLNDRGYDKFHMYFGRPYSTYLDELGCNDYVPYSVVYDRDGYIRMIDDPTAVWPRVIEQCLGLYEP